MALRLQTGFNITSSDIKKLLQQNDRQQNRVRTWRQLFGNASLGMSAQTATATSALSDTIARAYETNLAQQSAIAGAGLNAGATRELLADSRQNLNAAYETYIRNYGENLGAIGDAYGEEVNAINAALTQRAENFANVYNNVYTYLAEELYGSTYKDTDYFATNNMDWLLNDVEGEKVLRSWDDIKRKIFTNDGELNDRGIEFFDQVMNARPDGYIKTDDKGNVTSTRGFDEWLGAKDPELREWWAGTDMFNYTKAGTNKGTGNVILGRESTDDIYHTFEYLKGDEVSKYTNEAYAKMMTAKENLIKGPPNNTFWERMKYAGAPAREKYINENWLEYVSQSEKLVGDFVGYMQKTLGSDYYSSFYDEYVKMLDEYNAILEEAKTPKDSSDVGLGAHKFYIYDENIVNRLEEWQKKLFSMADRFVGERKGIKKASGY